MAKKNKPKKPQLACGFLYPADHDFLRLHLNKDHDKVRCHHVTTQFGCSALAAGAFAGRLWRADVLTVITDGDAVCALLGEVEVETQDGEWQELRPALDAISEATSKGRRGQRYHVTISHYRSVGAVHSNEVIKMWDEGDPRVVEVEPSWIVKGASQVGGTLGWMDGGLNDYTDRELLKGWSEEEWEEFKEAHNVPEA